MNAFKNKEEENMSKKLENYASVKAEIDEKIDGIRGVIEGLFSHGDCADHFDRIVANVIYLHIRDQLATLLKEAMEAAKPTDYNHPHEWKFF